jgi:hypothetical protein
MENQKHASGSPQSQQSGRWVRKPESKEIYSNQFFLNWSSTDARIRFGQMIPTSDIQTTMESVDFIIEENASVTMNWPQLKALRDVLTDAVNKYENTNGPIDIARLKLPK